MVKHIILFQLKDELTENEKLVAKKEMKEGLEALVGTTDEVAPTPEAKHPVSTTSTRFRDLEKQFGKNYNPGN